MNQLSLQPYHSPEGTGNQQFGAALEETEKIETEHKTRTPVSE